MIWVTTGCIILTVSCRKIRLLTYSTNDLRVYTVQYMWFGWWTQHPHLTFTCHLFKQIRIFTNTFTLTPYNGAEALVSALCTLLARLFFNSDKKVSSNLSYCWLVKIRPHYVIEIINDVHIFLHWYIKIGHFNQIYSLFCIYFIKLWTFGLDPSSDIVFHHYHSFVQTHKTITCSI